ncbi:MAG: Ribosome-binding factor [Candidatus Nomurabacteria bacterium]|jgi:ribosome-binding factor A|nr:Ribosome-binding factor [Candidatus Nomurabacteria bacterium]
MTIQSGRTEKIQDQIREIAARVVERESNKTALITITRVELFERGRKAMLYISVLPETGEDSAINFLKRKRAEIRDEVKQRLNIRTIPFLDAAIDTGEKARRAIDELLKE